jgi:hypothetical protein
MVHPIQTLGIFPFWSWLVRSLQDKSLWGNYLAPSLLGTTNGKTRMKRKKYQKEFIENTESQTAWWLPTERCMSLRSSPRPMTGPTTMVGSMHFRFLLLFWTMINVGFVTSLLGGQAVPMTIEYSWTHQSTRILSSIFLEIEFMIGEQLLPWTNAV